MASDNYFSYEKSIAKIRISIDEKESSKVIKQIAIDRCGSDHEQAVRLEEKVRKLDEDIINLNMQLESLLDHEKVGKTQDLSEEEKKVKEEKERKEEEISEDLKKKEKEQYYSSFSGFEEFHQEVRDFNQRENIQVDIDYTIENVSAKSLFEEGDLVKSRLKKTVLYVAAFFPKLSVHNFERIILFFLKEVTINVQVTSKIFTEKEEVKLVEIPERKDLGHVWQNSIELRDQILKECYIKAIYSKDSIKIIDFCLSYLKDDLKIYFEEKYPLYLEENFRRSKLLLFDSTSRIAISAMDLSVEMAISNPEAYGREWLSTILEYLKILDSVDDLSQTESHLSSAEWFELFMQVLDIEKQEELRLFSQSLKAIGKKQRNQFVFLRLSVFISQMLDCDKLEDEIENFFDWAIMKHQHAVLDIIKPLRKIQNFNQLYWIKQLLERGNWEVKEKAYMFLYSYLEQSSDLLYSKLESIKNWLPDLERPPDRYSPSNEYALRILFECAFEKISELQFQDYGVYPSKYLFFKSFDNSSNDDSKFQLLMEWIFHPGLRHIIDPDMSTMEAIGVLLSSWFFILWGVSNQDPLPETTKLAEKLIQHTKSASNPSQQKELIQVWSKLTEELLNEVESSAESGNGKKRREIIQRRNSIRQLKTKFKAS